MSPETILIFFQKFIEKELGIVYAEHNFFQLQNRLEEIAKLMSLESPQQLYERAQDGISGQFRTLLLDMATNNETSFFRDKNVFHAFEAAVIPSFLERRGAKNQMRIWSAACSSGQEAISTSILLNEYNMKAKTPVDFSILASDISNRVLDRAKKASYSQLEVQRGLPAPLLIKYFAKNENDIWTAKPEITKSIAYSSMNLKNPFRFSEKFDLIFCRNVLIYQSVESKTEILKRLTDQLEPNGFLILGAGESLIGLSQDYKQVYVDGSVIYQKCESQEMAA